MQKDQITKTYAPNRPKIEDRLAYTLLEAAGLLGVSYHTLWRALKLGDIHAIKSLGVTRIAKKELERFLDSKAEYRVRTYKVHARRPQLPAKATGAAN